MLGLPDASLSFTIPSLHDEKLLSCRVYLPKRIQKDEQVKRGAILAHPYAPLGGCYDDPVVGIVGSEILKHGWILTTFNFRGAGESQGHTSWTGKAEYSDYASVAGFLIQYLSHLEFQDKQRSESEPPESRPAIDLILGGYSYGSMIASRCPPIPSILAPFGANQPSSAAIEILLRAEHLATQTSEEHREAVEARLEAPTTDSPRKSSEHTLSVGGSETTPNKSPKRKDSRKSSDIRRSVDYVSRKMHLHKPRKTDDSATTKQETLQTATALQFDLAINTFYLLVSPLLPPISTLTALPFWKHSEDVEAQKMLTRCPTLAIFGSDDIFTAAKRLKIWGDELKKSNARFHWVEIEQAGHFWREPGTAQELVCKIGNWMDTLQGAE